MNPRASPGEFDPFGGWVGSQTAAFVQGVGFGPEVDAGAGESRVIIEIHAHLDGVRIVARLAEVIIGDAEVQVLPLGNDGLSFVSRRTDAAGELDGLIPIVKN